MEISRHFLPGVKAFFACFLLETIQTIFGPGASSISPVSRGRPQFAQPRTEMIEWHNFTGVVRRSLGLVSAKPGLWNLRILSRMIHEKWIVRDMLAT